jgi:hypothetical protein
MPQWPQYPGVRRPVSRRTPRMRWSNAGSSLRTLPKQSRLRQAGKPDCFVASALAMAVSRHASTFPRRDASGCAFSFAPERAQGKPGARCTRGLMCKIVQRNAHEHTGSAETLRPSLRNGFTAYTVLSPVTNSSCHRRQRIKVLPARSGSQNLR